MNSALELSQGTVGRPQGGGCRGVKGRSLLGLVVSGLRSGGWLPVGHWATGLRPLALVAAGAHVKCSET